jgi:hypothetical protein
MHYNLLFNGCSFTYGWELGGINNDEEHQRTHRFSHLVAEHYGKTYNNISSKQHTENVNGYVDTIDSIQNIEQNLHNLYFQNCLSIQQIISRI